QRDAAHAQHAQPRLGRRSSTRSKPAAPVHVARSTQQAAGRAKSTAGSVEPQSVPDRFRPAGPVQPHYKS
ncbi:Unknown protein, partial [Striga hermonthica]